MNSPLDRMAGLTGWAGWWRGMTANGRGWTQSRGGQIMSGGFRK